MARSENLPKSPRQTTVTLGVQRAENALQAPIKCRVKWE